MPAGGPISLLLCSLALASYQLSSDLKKNHSIKPLWHGSRLPSEWIGPIPLIMMGEAASYPLFWMFKDTEA